MCSWFSLQQQMRFHQQLFVVAIFWKLVCGDNFLDDYEKYQSFTPTVSHRCDRGQMVITVSTQKPFYGIIHPKGYRNEPCITQGTGSFITSLSLELHDDPQDPNYCGIQKKKMPLDIVVAVVVRAHPALELSEDKQFLLSCGKSGFRNARNKTSRVALRFYENGKRVQQIFYNQHYELKASMTRPDNLHKLVVKSCVSFSNSSSEVQLIDWNGCSLLPSISSFVYDVSSHSATAQFISDFKFPNSNQINIQCEVMFCHEKCEQGPCSNELASHFLLGIRNNTEDGQSLLTSVSALMLMPGDPILASSLGNCTEWQFPWLIGLCICLAILLLVMLIVNIFLCSSLTCTCTKTEVLDKEPSEMDDYDPYRVVWANGSHYGSRTSLHKPGYNSGGSTLNSTARSISNASDHYAIVHSRPGSHYSHQEYHTR